MNNTYSFEPLMTRAGIMQRKETDPLRIEWWEGYMLGLGRGHHGEGYNQDRHEMLMTPMSKKKDPMLAAFSRGYRAGITMQLRNPD
jgi:ribosome modulation factor